LSANARDDAGGATGLSLIRQTLFDACAMVNYYLFAISLDRDAKALPPSQGNLQPMAEQ
jgi:hypothetical protein